MLMGDLNRRRGMIQGMEEHVMAGKVNAEVPSRKCSATLPICVQQLRVARPLPWNLKYAEAPKNVAEE